MATINCEACEELRQNAPGLIVNGFDEDMCTSLMNDTGLAPGDGSDDCEDLNNMNDCLVGNMAREVDAYDVCDWKEFTKNFITNVWTTLKGIICAICGLWKMAKRIDCIVDYMAHGATFNVKETEQSDSAYIVAGKGVSFYLADGTTEHTSDILFRYIAGGMATLMGSCHFYMNNNFNEPNSKQCPNFDNDSTSLTNNGYRVSNSRKKNTVWGQTGRPAIGGELVYEIRIKKSQYPQIRQIFQGRGTEANAGGFTVHFQVFNEGSIAYGQHGWCHDANYGTPGAPMQEGYSWGHRVPKGWIYVQCRMHWVDAMGSTDGLEYSPYGYLPMRINADEVIC